MTRKSTSPGEWGSPQIQWNTEGIRRLSEIIARGPEPSNEVVAAEMGITPSAVQTVKSRFSPTRHALPTKDVKWPQYQKPLRSQAKRLRFSLNCSRSSGSEEIQRLCDACGNGASAVDNADTQLEYGGRC